MKRMPKGHQPKSHAWTADFPDTTTTIIYVQFGIQHRSLEPAHDAYEQIGRSLQGLFAPRHVDSATAVDVEGYTNDIWIAYWDNPEIYEAWKAQASVQEWLAGVPTGATYGYWHEALTIPKDHFETIHSSESATNGVSHFTPLKYTTMHEYWGSMRDRMSASEHDDFVSPLPELPKPQVHETRGRHIRVKAPDHVAFIRTGQDWSKCGPEERETYETEVQPTLSNANDYLASRDAASGCISSLMLQEPGNKSCVTAYFLSLKHMEDWTMSHPTHVAIFRVFFKMLETYNYKTQLALWHEVFVLQSDHMDLFYSNCHPQTGFLPHFHE
ncbi:MAG: phenylacetaldoxime dehydratase family protein [Tumebacillaceae bacterium]